MHKILLTSDLHFSHKRITEITDRNKVTSKEEHNEWLVELWNNQADNGTLTYHLGDFCFATRYDVVAEIVSKLKGQKIFIKGNHDKREHLEQLKKDNLIQNWYDYKEIKLGEQYICLFHFSISNWHKQHYGSWMLHGHSHGNFQGQGKCLDVGLDSSYNLYGKHKFFTEQDIAEFMQQRTVHIADQHREYKE